MQELIEGIHKFRTEEFGQYKALFQRLAKEGQNPHTLFITCSDSRVLAELITQSKPGDLFVVKNVGNIVPATSATGSTNSTAAAIEFAVETLGVQDVVVCGHSQCGAMKALMTSPDLSSMPHLEGWLSVATPVRDAVLTRYGHLRNLDEQVDLAGEENVLYGLESLKTYPCVKSRLEEGRLRLHAWFFKIATAELFAYDPAAHQFMPLVGAKQLRFEFEPERPRA
ncbi:MAG: carbonic anhydrase [Chthoniobacterales bacterium]